MIFVNSNEIREQIKQIKLSKGLVRDPKDQRNYLEEDKRSFVLRGITTRHTDKMIANAFKIEYDLEVKATRLINRQTGLPIGKVKITCDSARTLQRIPYNLSLGDQFCTTEPYRSQLRLIQCNRCQLFGQYRGQCKAIEPKCGKCTGPHMKNDCKRDTPKCVNCAGAHESSSNTCPKAVQLREKLLNNISKKVDNAKDQLIRGNKQIQYTGDGGRGWSIGNDCKVRLTSRTTLTGDDLLLITRAIAAAGKMVEMKRKAGDAMDDDWAPFITMCINQSFESDLCPSKIRNITYEYIN